MKLSNTLFLAVSTMLLASSAHAQYSFTDTALMPYKQDFNSLSGTVGLTGNQLTALPEVYAQAEFGTLPYTAAYSPTSIGNNDGSNTYANYYHFGPVGTTVNDRSLGGIAATTTADGIGYVGIRFKNGSTVTIKNLEVQYAMEQWYNSGRQDAASVSVSYLMLPVGTPVTSLLESAGAWKTIAPLQVNAPSTATVIASRDGNAAANRRVRQTTLAGINLLPGQEIMIRWGYTLNNTTNGNGLSVDDVVVTPETNVYYVKRTGNLDDLASWGQNPDGSGTGPTSFEADNQTFYVLGGTATDRISTASPGATGITGTWTVSGANSKIVVGMPATATTGTAATPGQLYLEYNKNIVGTIDVSDGSTLTIRNTNPNRTYALGSLGITSTVEYSGGTSTSLITQSYGNLVISGNAGATTPTAKTLAGNIIVNGSVRLRNMCSLTLGSYDLTLVRRDSLSNGVKYNANIVRGASATSYIVAGGTGRLRISVPGNGVGIVFPVGVSAPTSATATAYTPATLQQTAANSEDIFGVRLLSNLYNSYSSTTEAGSGTPKNELSVNKTWLVSEEVAGGSDLSLTLQYNSGDATGDFVPGNARLIHYLYATGAWDEHTTASEWGATTGTTTGSLAITRAHITSFSPFGIVSVDPTPLPVSLTAFDVQATGAAAACTWATASETNNDHFVVERSLDGATFAALGVVKGQGTHAATTGYRFEDVAAGSLGAPVVYYRLRQVDTDGRASYSAVRTVSFGAAALALYPTPTLDGAATLDLTRLAPRTYQARVLDLAGRVLLTRTVLGGQAQPFDVQSLPAGAYVVVITGADTRQSLRLLRN
ncbi:T9SS type A sorting domain-containing protein [Hymenobacter sp. BT559]|uniref:T9SS type A sorting domain-containing protein n=1 Tax=Hymenobacter sp. BT559 TaxID=2795729 RepID=UPI0018ED2821|nr:T9SS type A sorting domain-containing protein [Hymenobacter sp. BT559]MBJ6144788.1 T9SS type A sorting domain-containing protein [Hymenobacter sp. BT559]